jgi:hypothetical protein
MISNSEKPRWFFYLGWVVLNVFAVLIAWYFAWNLISLIEKVVGGTIQVGGRRRITEDFLLMYVLFPMIGLVTGILQYILLRRYLPRMAWWIAATLVGWLLPFSIGFIITGLLVPDNSTLLVMFGMLLIGATIALPQWWMLRQRVHQPSWWILACGFGWLMIGIMNRVTSEPLPVLLAIALMPAIATGIACWLLLDWVPTHKLKSSIPNH